MTNPIYTVILAGGSGTRFWPASRMDMPKQFTSIVGEKSLLEETVARVDAIIPQEQTIMVGGLSHKAIIDNLLKGTGVRTIYEPIARNTAPCIGLAAVHILGEAPDALMAVLPADHFVGDLAGFGTTLRRAFDEAGHGGIVTIGIPPSRPETGYGYIKKGRKIGGSQDAWDVERFVEKPGYATALEYLAEGSYLWNSGIFVLPAKVALEELAVSLEGGRNSFSRIMDAVGSSDYDSVLNETYRAFPSISFDYAVMERTSRQIKVIPGDFPWSDVGNWLSLYELRSERRDGAGNVLEGDAISVDCRGCLVRCLSNRTVAALGLDDILIVDTDDALLVSALHRSQEVRKVVDELKARQRTELL